MTSNTDSIIVTIEDPLGRSHQVTVPHTANVQQFTDSLVTRLGLPVINYADEGISYWLEVDEGGRRLQFDQPLDEVGLTQQARLRLACDAQLMRADNFVTITKPDDPSPLSRGQLLSILLLVGWVVTSVSIVKTMSDSNPLWLLLFALYLIIALGIYRLRIWNF